MGTISTGLSKKQFESVFSTGKIASSKGVKLITAEGTGKIGVATAKKIGCHARRNRVKRRIKEACRFLDYHFNSSQNYVLIVGVRGMELSLDQIKDEVVTLLRK